MTDPIKFGPGWLRNQISSVEESRASSVTILGGNSCSSIVNNGGVAKYRYGREEVIAAFDKDLKPPEIYYKKLFVDKMQPPMALSPADEDNVSLKSWGGRINNYRNSRLPRGLAYGGFNRSTENECSQFPDSWKTSNFAMDSSLKFPSTDVLNILPSESAVSDMSLMEITPLSNLMTSNHRFYNRTSIRPSRSVRSGSSEVEKFCLTNQLPATNNSWNSTIAPSRKEYNNKTTENWRENWRGSRQSWNNRSSSWRDVEPEEKVNEALPEWAVDTPINSGGTFDSTGAFLGSHEIRQDSTTEGVVDMVEKLIMEESEPEHKESCGPVQKWFYRDPHMKVQGPFTGSEMTEWYNHGYFDENLCVRREIDERFATLGEFIKLCGNVRVFEYEFVVPALKAEPPINLSILMSSLIPEQQTIFVNQLMLQNGFSEYLMSLQNLNSHICPAPVPTSSASTPEFSDLMSGMKDCEIEEAQPTIPDYVLENKEESTDITVDETPILKNVEDKQKRISQKSQPIKKESKKKTEKKDIEKPTQFSAPTPSVAPWSSTTISRSAPPISLAEIQKAERRERRHEEQQKHIGTILNETVKDNLLTWTKILPPPSGNKSFAEIQAEEAKELAAVTEQQKKQRNEELSTSIVTSTDTTWATAWKVIPPKEQLPQMKKKEVAIKKKIIEEKRKFEKNEKPVKKDDGQTEFFSWCYKSLSNLNSKIDVSTFVTFLQDLDSPYEIKDYIRAYFGDSKESNEFAKQFLEKRSKFKNLQRASQAHNDDLCQPAPAINPGATDFAEVKGKPKKQKKSKMTKLDARILGFSVTAAQDRINVGDRDYGDAV